MKINILYKFKDGAWGGANQFLGALKKELIKNGLYSESPDKADIIIFNGYPFQSEYFFYQAYKLKKHTPRKVLILRLDGPISFYRKRDRDVDKIIAKFNKLLVDGIIFQSRWSREKNKEHFNVKSANEIVIYNSPDTSVFFKGENALNGKKKTRILAASWSSNWQKGFDIYKFLDKNLDFEKYEMTFVGNSPIGFTNINHLAPVEQIELARLIREHDIFITASRSDPCSNVVIEALSCGKPVVARNEGGHPEIARKGGEFFYGHNDVLSAIEKVRSRYNHYQAIVPEFSIAETTQEYVDFARKIIERVELGKYVPKRVEPFSILWFGILQLSVMIWKISKGWKWRR
ncbi:glycosyltransferase family 4 protein [Candidatus Omnitrophota bacterium]